METKNIITLACNIRTDIVRMLTEAGSGHLGGSLGLADIFAYLYSVALNHKPQNPNWEGRDKVVLSIGHVAPVLYASLANAGYFDRKELLQLRKFQSRLQGHPSLDSQLPGIETSSGSLGQGLGIAVGMALADKIDSIQRKIYCILGDGELQEGSIWEAAMSASNFKLNNIIAIIDRNKCQIDGKTEDVMKLEPLSKKWESFGWNTLECDGHHFKDIDRAFNLAKAQTNKPSVIIAHTKMGKGISEIENDYRWHGKVPNKEQSIEFIKELTNSLNK
ncbi:MAG: transketolase [Sphingobacteriia bacterium]|nr:transketolase [Sphingobacteriia bacterium]